MSANERKAIKIVVRRLANMAAACIRVARNADFETRPTYGAMKNAYTDAAKIAAEPLKAS